MTNWYKFYLHGPSDADEFSSWVNEVVDWLQEQPRHRVKFKGKVGFGPPDRHGWSNQTALLFVSFKNLTDATLFKISYHEWIIDDFCARGLVKVIYSYDESYR